MRRFKVCFSGMDDIQQLQNIPSLYGFLVLQLHPPSQPLEVIHQGLELLPQPANDGRAGPVGRGPGTGAREVPVSGIGTFEGFELALDELDTLEDLFDVGVHSGSELLHGLGVVDDLALLVGVLQLPVEPLHNSHVLLNILNVLEELVEIRRLFPGFHVVQVRLLLQVRVPLERA